LEVIPAHRQGWLWLSDRERLFQFSVDEDWNARLVRQFATVASSHCGLAHDGENLWRGTYDGQTRIWYVIDDGVVESLDLAVDPESGGIPARDSESVAVTVSAGDSPAGIYNVLLTIEITAAGGARDDLEPGTIELSAVVCVRAPVAQLAGEVTSFGSDDPIEGVRVDMDRYIISRFTDDEGAYALSDLPLGNYTLTFTARDFLPHVEEVALDEAGEVELDVALLHSECSPGIEGYATSLEPGMSEETRFEVENGGNGPLTYRVERRLLGEANADPWELRRTYDIEDITQNGRLYGVVFTGERYYVSGGMGGGRGRIYILNPDGEVVGQFDQFMESINGMRDLTWDGELLWGADGNNIFGFTTGGELVTRFAGPVNPCRAMAWDPDREVLWVCESTTHIFAVDREGNQVANFARPGDLRTFGMSYYPQDPDGFDLYLFCRSDSSDMVVGKLNPGNGDWRVVADIDDGSGDRPRGMHITNEFDIYSWVLVGIVGQLGGDLTDRMKVWQVDARRDWMRIDPDEGRIAAGESQRFTLTLDATGLPEAVFEGELVFVHDGVGGETSVPVTLEVAPGRVMTHRTIRMSAGWNLVSVNLQPEEEDVVVLTDTLVEAGLLELMKDGAGNFYYPARDFNRIPGWYSDEGYMMKVVRGCELTLTGMSVMAADTIVLDEGWHLVSYYPRVGIEATVALSGIEDHLVLAKDGRGSFYVPSWGFSNMGDMVPGQGYQLKVDGAVELIYQTTRGDGDRVAHRSVGRSPEVYPELSPTGFSHSLLVFSDAGDGTEVGVYASGRLVGSGVLSDGVCGVAVWGDDPTTAGVEGAVEGQALEVRLVEPGGADGSSSSFILHPSSFSVAVLDGDLSYRTDGLTVIRASSSAVPSEFGIDSVYPNPFNSATRVSFSLPEASRVTLGVYDAAGRMVSELIRGNRLAGTQGVTFNAVGLPSGVYLLRMEAGGKVDRFKTVLIR
jgi:hypothetical protein